MRPVVDEALCSSVVEIARRAGAEIMTVYTAGSVGTTVKADRSPLTGADLRSNSLIEKTLASIAPGIPVLSEESGEVTFAVRERWARYWLVDPLDGTKEFLSRNGEFTVNIALIEGHEPVLGVVHAPARGTTYWGRAGSGAWRQEGVEAPKAIRAQLQASKPARVVGSRSHRGDSLDGFLEALGPYEMLAVGSSLKLCMVAEGSADLYPRLGPTSEGDTAAAQAVAEAAGATVVRLDGSRLEYNAKSALLNPSFVVYADRRRDWLGPLRTT